MTNLIEATREPAADVHGPSGGRAATCLLGLGAAVPGPGLPQAEIGAQLAEAWGLSGAALERWQRLLAGSCIETRHFVEPIERVVGLTTAQRMRRYEAAAPPLALDAAQRALAHAGIDAGEITDLIVVSCTGLSAPGIDVALTRSLDLRRDVRRSMVGFMGCFGAISGLRAGVGACAAEPDAVVLVVCVELCSLHARRDPCVENQVASALFADGAAAAVIAGDVEGGRAEDAGVARVDTGRSLLIPEDRDAMSWRIGDEGFVMQLSARVPALLEQSVAGFVAMADPRPRTLLVHPGGPEVLRAVEAALDLAPGTDLAESWTVLRRFGNMSSATVLFVLDAALRRGARLPGLLLAFGPGLTLESMGVRRTPLCDVAR